MKYVIRQAKTVEDAVKEALLELEISKEQAIIEIIEEGNKGFLGIIGSKEAKVKVIKKHDPVEISTQFLKNIIDTMGIDARIEAEEADKELVLSIEGIDEEKKGLIIGKRGSTLDSLQYLVSLAVNKDREDYLKVVLDCEGYRSKREETLKRLANKMADKAKNNNRPVKLEPMNPYERRIIHSALQDYKGINTYSEGEEPYRRIVIQSK